MSIKEKPPEFFKSVKTSLKSILKHPDINSSKINEAVIKANKIVIHTLQFLKLYLLHHYENNNNSLPKISKVDKKCCKIRRYNRRRSFTFRCSSNYR